MNYYIEKNNKIVLFDTNYETLKYTLEISPQYKNLDIQETERPLVLSEDRTYYVFADTEEYKQEQAEKRKEEFNNNFIITSWGAFRKNPKGYSSAVEAVNTIFNMVNVAQALTDELAQLLIFYEVPDFTDAEQCTEEWLVAHQKTHEACDLATFMQWYLEFQTVWASTQYTDIPVPQMEL